jgi:hypothetical protein
VAVKDTVDACSRQKHGKAVQPDGIANEDGRSRLEVHFCMLLNKFIHLGYLPRQFMPSVISSISEK